jgi:putative peptide zinc metalloprotease protein
MLLPPCASTDKPLPLMREDLVLSEGPRGPNNEPTWRVYDPLRHRFIAIENATRLVLDLWREHRTVSALAQALSLRLKQPVDAAHIEDLCTFLRRSHLLQDADEGDWRRRRAAEDAHQHGLLMRLVHNYLFFRFPLFAPAALLARTAPSVAILFYRRVQLAIIATGALGLLFVSRQWDMFLSDARALVSLSGIAQFGVTLFVVKILHEFGHAYSAHRQGCRVPVMGVAFMMMAPVLYTDVTDAWRLTDWRRRFAIDIAGVAVELGIACIATFLWVFLPDGGLRQTAFLLATTSWTMSVAINLNPFMRFDGYYIASDLIGVENLQSRAFDLGLWRMREWLFGLGCPTPEPDLPKARVQLLIVYAWGIWLYRVVLFTGIALTVYAYFFKALGIIMFLFEIGYFLAKPVLSELKVWWSMRKSIVTSKRTAVTSALLAAVMVASIVPWSTSVRVPAVLDAAETARLFAPRAAQVVSVVAKRGHAVLRGEVLFQLQSPELENDWRVTRSRLTSLELRLARSTADKDDRDDLQVLVSSRIALMTKLSGIERERAELNVTAPFDGYIAEVNSDLHAGRWVGTREQLALVRGANGGAIIGYLREPDLWRVDIGANGVFIPELPLATRVSARLVRVSSASASEIEQQELATPHGGSIDVQGDGRGSRLVPTLSHYQVVLSTEPPATAMRMRGVLHIEGQAESFFSSLCRHILKVLVRESAA